MLPQLNGLSATENIEQIQKASKGYTRMASTPPLSWHQFDIRLAQPRARGVVTTYYIFRVKQRLVLYLTEGAPKNLFPILYLLPLLLFLDHH